jgi:glutathione S-transferase
MEVTGFDPIANRLVFEAYFKPLFGGETDAEVVEELRGRLEGVLDGMERILGGGSGRKYMAGELFSLVDIFYAPYTHKLSVLYGEKIFEGRKRLRGWWEKVRERPSVKLIGKYGLEGA